MRRGRRSLSYLPRSAFACDSTEGVAEPSTTGQASRRARITATSRPWYRGLSSCL